MSMNLNATQKEQQALDYAKKAVTQSIYDKGPLRVAARLYIKHGLLEEACELCKKITILYDREN